MKNTWTERAKKIVNLKQFNKYNYPEKVFDYTLDCPHTRQYILRMKIREPHGEFKIPKELEWCKDLILKCDEHQKANGINHPYCYITVRKGKVTSVTDDEWHTDGYSEVITHIPEQNYIVTDRYCTEWLATPLKFPKDFSALKHNVVSFINKTLPTQMVIKAGTAKPNEVNLFDPYVIHRRPKGIEGKERTFVRVTFLPIEIYDDNCEQNPLYEEKIYNRTASCVRDTLVDY